MPLTIGQTLDNRYRIVKLLGQGGFGAVYRAWDTRIERACAIKENLETSQEAQRQFLREAKILANLTHPNLPRVTDHFIVPGQGQYLVMDYVEGENLEQNLDRSGGAIPEAQALAWVFQVCEALDYLHNQSPPVIHRDIKPANIKITPQERAVLVDFGIAKVYEANTPTTKGARAITEGYSPYEQYGKGVTDARSDIYALGATFYHLLTGQIPVESVQRFVRDPLVPAEQLNPSISAKTASALRRSMQVDPEQRFQSAAEFRAALLAGPPQPPVSKTVVAPIPSGSNLEGYVSPPAPPPEKPKNALPWAWVIGGAALLLVAVLLLGIWAGSQSGKVIPPAPTVTLLAVAAPATPTRSLDPSSTSPPPAPIKIGLLSPLSGAVPTFGVSVLEGAQLAVKEWNDKGGVLGRKIELVVADSQCEADPAVNAANKLIDQDGVKFLVGEVCSKASIPVSEIAGQKGVVQISPTSTNKNVTLDIDGKTKSYIFRACFIDPFQGLVMAKFAAGKGFKTAFIMYDQGNDYTVGLAQAFEKAFTELGGQIVGKETYTTQDTDFSAILTKVGESKAEVLFLPDYYNIANLVGQQAKDRGVTAVIMGGDGWDSSDLDVKAVDGGFFSNHYFSGDTRPIVVDWLQKYGAAYKDASGNPKVPDALATLAYDAANLMIAAIEKAGVEDTARVAEAMAALSWEGVSGKITFDAQHNPIKAAAVIGVMNGAFTFVEFCCPMKMSFSREFDGVKPPQCSPRHIGELKSAPTKT